MASCISNSTAKQAVLFVGTVVIIAVVAAAMACFAFQIKGVMGQAVGRPLFALTMTIGCVGVVFCLSAYGVTNKIQNEEEKFKTLHPEQHAVISTIKGLLLIGLAASVTLIALAICFQRGSLSLHSFAKASLITSVVTMTLQILTNKCCSRAS